jgi:hypothetical protein
MTMDGLVHQHREFGGVYFIKHWDGYVENFGEDGG